jgi:hypothetical protein
MRTSRLLIALLIVVSSQMMAQSASSGVPPGATGVAPNAIPHGEQNTFPTTLSPMEYRMRLVEWNLGFDDPKQIGSVSFHAMGDEAAFHIYRIMNAKKGLTLKETRNALEILHRAFESLAAVSNGADKKPKKALVLLDILQSTAADQLVKERIASERTFLLTLPEQVGTTGPLGPHIATPDRGATPFH